MNLIFVRDRFDIESYGLNKQDCYFCLTFDAYVYAGEKGVKRVYAFEKYDLHRLDYYGNGVYLSNEFINALHCDVSIGQDERLYLVSRLVTFFSMLLFDVELCKTVVAGVQDISSIWCFKEEPVSIVDGKWTPYTGYCYFSVALSDFSSAKNINFYQYNKSVSSKADVARGFRLYNKFQSWLDNNPRYDLGWSYNKLIDRKKKICFVGVRGKDARGQFTSDLTKYGYRVVFLRTTGLYIQAIKYLSRFIAHRSRVVKKKAVNALLDVRSVVHRDHRMTDDDRNLINIDSALELILRKPDCFLSEIVDLVLLFSNFQAEKKWNIQRLRRNDPIAVVGQESMPVVIAANNLNVVTFQLPHGGIVTPQLAPMIASYNITSSADQSNYYETSGMVTNKCTEIGVSHLSLSLSDKKLNDKVNFDKKCMVILAKNMGMRRWEFDDYSSYIDIFAEVIKVAKSNSCNVIIKLHPSGGRHMYDTYSRLETLEQEHVSISMDDCFSEILNSASVVVAMQESSALYQAVCAQLPVVFPVFHYSAPYLDNSMMQILRKSLCSPENIEDLSTLISNITSTLSGYSNAVNSQERLMKSINCLSCDDAIRDISSFMDKHLSAK